MKRKLFYTIVSIVLAIVCFSATACSCGGTPALSFSNGWNLNAAGTTSLDTIGYTETATYSVALDDDFITGEYNFKKNDALDEQVEYAYESGVYTTITKIVPISSDVPNYDCDILTGEDAPGSLIHLTTTYTVNAKYTFKDNAENNYDETDYITTETYFCLSNASFTPIFSRSEGKYASLYVDDDSAYVMEVEYKNEITYSKNSYTITKFNTDDTVKDTKTYNCSYKTAIDNTQLLFVLRNVTLEEKATTSLPTVAPAYGDAKTLNVERFADEAQKITVNGKEQNVPTSRLAFEINSTGNSGKAQLVYIQSAKTKKLNMNSLLVKYVEPLTAYGSFYSMGALVFTLKTVDIVA